MTKTLAVAVASLLLAGMNSGPGLAQAPLPAALMNGRSLYLEPQGGIERKWLNHAANEFISHDRFTLVGSSANADLVATLTFDTDSWWKFKADVFQLIIRDVQTDELVWEDARPVNFAKRGAVLDLVKDLHTAIRLAPQ